MNISIEKSKKEDVKGIHAIECRTFTTPWSYESIYEDICRTSIAYYLVAKDEQLNILGYIGMWHILDEAHITNIAVDETYRKRGIASALLSCLIYYSEQSGIKRMTLEVREKNDAAIKLYEKYGFESYGMRPGYYQDTNENAIIMWKEL